MNENLVMDAYLSSSGLVFSNFVHCSHNISLLRESTFTSKMRLLQRRFTTSQTKFWVVKMIKFWGLGVGFKLICSRYISNIFRCAGKKNRMPVRLKNPTNSIAKCSWLLHPHLGKSLLQKAIYSIHCCPVMSNSSHNTGHGTQDAKNWTCRTLISGGSCL